MKHMPPDIARFLEAKRIAVAGVSRDPHHAANAIYMKLKDAGYEVFPVNPRSGTIAGAPFFPDLKSIPGGVEAVVAATPPEGTTDIVLQCLGLGIDRIWIHRSFGSGSLSDDAVHLCRDAAIPVISGACPMMYVEPVDVAHRCIRGILRLTGKLPG